MDVWRDRYRRWFKTVVNKLTVACKGHTECSGGCQRAWERSWGGCLDTQWVCLRIHPKVLEALASVVGMCLRNVAYDSFHIQNYTTAQLAEIGCRPFMDPGLRLLA